MFKNQYELTVDLKKSMTSVIPTFVQYDNASLIFKVLDGGETFNLESFTKAEIVHKRPDGKLVVGNATIEGAIGSQKILRYDYLGSEMTKAGYNETSLILYSSDKKVSIQPFKVKILEDIGEGVLEESNQERGLLQYLIAKVENLVESINSWKHMGEYNPSISYKKNNIVMYSGESFIAIKDSKGISPIGEPNDTNWRLLARRGVDGDGAVVLYKDTFKASKNQRTFTLSNRYDPLQTRIRVIVGGSEQFSPENFMETTSKSFTLNYNIAEGEDVVAVYFGQAPAIVNDLQAQISGMNTIVQRVDTNLESKVNIPDTSESFISTANQSAFTLKNGTYATGRGSLKVIVGGVEQYPILNFTETSNKIFTLSEPLKAGINVNVLYKKI